jgi:hypothetical protein
MEEPRPGVTTEAILTFFQHAIEIVDPAHFIFNMDEIGGQDWADRTEKAGIVPADHAEKHVGMLA